MQSVSCAVNSERTKDGLPFRMDSTLCTDHHVPELRQKCVGDPRCRVVILIIENVLLN
jgi:hypothetical protein